MDGLPIDINIPESELVRMEEVIRGRGRFIRRNSIDRVGAIKSKNTNRESIMGRDNIGAIENLTILFQDVEKYAEHIDEFYEKRQMHFLKEMKAKMLEEDYYGFLASLELFRVPEGGRIIDEGKYHNFHYILIEGEVAAYSEKK